MSKRSAAIVLRAEYAELSRLESFVDDFGILCDETRRRVKISAAELFDNIVAHGLHVRPPHVFLRLSAGREIRIILMYRATNFKELIDALKPTVGVSNNGHKAIRYDAASGRYRGLGLVMCRCLCERLEARAGLIANRITATFPCA